MMKLLSLLMACASAEGAEVIGGADAANEIVVESPIPLLTKGLIVTAVGLGGVFLVLLLFFLMIKIMQKALK